MKKIILIMLVGFSIFAISLPVLAQTDPPGSEAVSDAINLTTFAGIVACVSLIVTQISKVIPAVASKSIFKILISLAVGIVITFFAWWLSLAAFLDDMLWWQVLIQGVLSGGAASGIYDLIKSLFSKQE